MNNNPYEAPNSPQNPQYAPLGDYRNNPYAAPNSQQYANPNDQPLMVPKRFGYGVSPNWNNPRAVKLFFGFIGAIVVFVVLIAVVVPLLVRLMMR